VRIPLDYYQILAVPESSLSELEQSYRDRLLQLPQQGYSDAAIESRKQLITSAYQVLSDPIQRERYESERLPSELTGTEEVATSSFYRRPDLDIAPEHFLGGLLILFERGEYEEINSICMPYLGNNGRNSNSGSLHPHPLVPLTTSGNLKPDPLSRIEPTAFAKLERTDSGDRVIPLKPDIVLTMVLSFLELGDREWRDRCHEEAVIHFETAQKILIQEDLFPQIQGQIERRLERLRPYRIAALVSLPIDRHDLRRQGIQFLEELLETACINEVQCQQRFGLNSDRMIQFIHENLPYLTAAEQRNLFGQVARDVYQSSTNVLNSMQLACTYLHVYASIAQGFAYRNPGLIYTAQQILLHRLGQRLPVTTEQAICALLLGQTEEAERILSIAPESAEMVVIRQQSQGLPDLIRGLCWYVESWLKDSVFPCFRDLVTADPSIHDYFNNRDVQDFADRIPGADRSVLNLTTALPILIDVPPSGDLSEAGNFSGEVASRQTLRYQNEHRSVSPYAESPSGGLAPTNSGFSSGFHSSRLDTVLQTPNKMGSGIVSPAMRVEQTPPPSTLSEPTVPAPIETDVENVRSKVIQLESERQRRRPSMPTARTIDGEIVASGVLQERRSQPAAFVPNATSQLVPSRKGRGADRLVRSRRTRRKPNIPRILLVGTGGIACLWGISWVASRIADSIAQPQQPILTNSAPNPKPIDIHTNGKPGLNAEQPSPKVTTGSLTNDIVKQTVQNWLSAKANSLNQNYQTEQLKDILAEPALSAALDRAQTAKANGVYWQYQHSNIVVTPISETQSAATAATVRVQVKEDARYYEKALLIPSRSYSKTLLVEYSLVRQQDRWYVKNMDVIKEVSSE
jgi:ARC6-like, IMS domain/DnaJ domain